MVNVLLRRISFAFPFLALVSFFFFLLLSSVCSIFYFVCLVSCCVCFLSYSIASGLSCACVLIAPAGRLVDLFHTPPFWRGHACVYLVRTMRGCLLILCLRRLNAYFFFFFHSSVWLAFTSLHVPSWRAYVTYFAYLHLAARTLLVSLCILFCVRISFLASFAIYIYISLFFFRSSLFVFLLGFVQSAFSSVACGVVGFCCESLKTYVRV